MLTIAVPLTRTTLADPGTMNEILDLVAKLDVRRTQVLIEAAMRQLLGALGA